MQTYECKSNIEGIDAVFVLSVKKFTDRIKHINAQMKETQLEFTFIFDFDIPDLTDEILGKYFDVNPLARLSYRSLILKNILVWQICLKYSFKQILVLEDDAVLHKDFKSKINQVVKELNELQPSYYVFLGGAQSKIPKHFHLGANNIVELKGDTTEGYIIDYEACRKLLEWVNCNKIDLPIDALINKLSPQIGIRQYWSKSFLVEQGSMWGLFESSLDGKRRRRSKLENILRYKLVVFKRRTLYKWFYRSRFKIFGF